MTDNKYLNSPKEFHLEMPLYYEIDIQDENVSRTIHSLMAHTGTVDAYCTWCKKESVFDTTRSYHNNFESWRDADSGIMSIKLSCSRDTSHEYHIYYFKGEKTFQKFGQLPSTADFQIPKAEKYRIILGEEKYKEFVRGIGLAAHGVGIGSFVYLRRIFEDLINEAHIQASQKRFAEKKYSVSRMDEKIKLLENYLPAFLVENRSLYKILSTGIHELNESECLKYFETVKLGIEQILDEKIIQQERERKAKAAKAAIQSVTQEVKKPVTKVQPMSFKIIKGTYGVQGQDKDVTNVLLGLVKDNKLQTTADNALTPDPAPGIPKFLTIEYENNGTKYTKQYKENDSVNLPEVVQAN